MTRARMFLGCILLPLLLLSAAAEDTARTTSRRKAAVAGTKKYLLQYKFASGDVLRTKVIHQAAVKTSIDGTSQTAETLSISVKRWQVTDIDDDGRISFVHSVEYVNMKNDVTGRDTVRFDSRAESDTPPEFTGVAKRVGVPLTKIVMDSSGKIIRREELAPGATNPSQMTMPLPSEPIAVGHTWTFPYHVNVNLRSGTVKKIQLRQRFELVSVKDGIAEVQVATQVLSPVNNPEIEAQLVQRQSSGTLRFDIAAGRVVGQQVDLDRRVVGYPNPKSSMHYRTRFTEKLLGEKEETASRPAEKER